MDSNDNASCSNDSYISSREEVRSYLDSVKMLVDEERWAINNLPWKSKVNKTQLYLAENNISDQDVANVIQQLQVCNYSYTTNDYNSKFPGEKFWIFGKTMVMVDKEERLYIKLKIRTINSENVLVMSFHPEKPTTEEGNLEFPYQD